MFSERKVKYSIAINEAIIQLMRKDASVILIGQGVKSPWYVGNTCTGLIKEFGEERVIDTPVSENAITGAAVGAALAGMKSIVVHPRADFVLYAFDPIINQAANWHYMSGGNASAPVVFWLIVNRGGEQAAQHSQALHSIFSHVPGLKVVAPSNAYDAKGILISAVNDPDPVVFIDDRWLYGKENNVPEEMYEVQIGKAFVKKQGKDITLISSSYTSFLCEEVSTELMKTGIDVEFVDLCTLKPYDKETILSSVKKTGKSVIVDGSWKTFGYAAEISAMISENIFSKLKAPVERLCLPDAPAPASRSLEENYYISKEKIIEAIHKVINYSE
ncbi:MAG TPA: transketolase C-terminal domain-containing protein [Bacteroidales bacterium]|nr:transketolase C-terminal domain-containing protein [Bacteroidales bacterium]HPS17088.1 transketolase C-terminal domain-containing protein [Bacteroidales bacterium]